MKRILLTALLLAGLLPAQKSAETLFQQALMKERSQGDIKGAIEIYQRIANDGKTDRKLASKALLEMARCEEKQGGEQARRTYERLIKDYSDQPDAIATARARISALTVTAATGPRIRQIWSGDDVDSLGSISPDGRWLTYTHWETGDLGVRDLSTNTNKLLTNTGGWEKSGGQYAEDSRFSPDGKRIAYNWFVQKRSGKEEGYEMRIMNADGSGIRTLAWLNGDHVPEAWSPDGHWLAVSHSKYPDGGSALSVMSTVNGERRELIPPASLPLIKGAAFSPDGKWIAYSGGRRSAQDIYVVPFAGGPPQAVAENPAQDMHPAWSKDGKSLLFLSDRSRSFGLWQVPIENGRASGPAKLVRGDFGQDVRGLGFTASGTLAYSTRITDNNIYEADLDPATGTVGKPVLLSDQRPGANGGPSLDKEGKVLTYYSNTPPSNTSLFVLRDLASGIEKTISIPREWSGRRASPGDERILFQSPGAEPNSLALFWFDPKTGQNMPLRTISQVRLPLHSVLSRDGKTLYYLSRELQRRAFSVIAMDVASGETRTIYKTGVVEDVNLESLEISRDGKSLAIVRTAFSAESVSQLLLLSVNGGDPRTVTTDQPIGWAVNGPEFSHDGRAVYLSRRKKGSNVRDNELIRIDLATGATRQVGLNLRGLGNTQVHPSGKKIYFKAGDYKQEIWLAENIIPSR